MDKQMYSPYALRRSCCCERHLKTKNCYRENMKKSLLEFIRFIW